MSLLKIKDWLLVKDGKQFKVKTKLTNEQIAVVNRIIDDFEFELNEPMLYRNNGEWLFYINYFYSDKIHVDGFIRRPNYGSDSFNFHCEINDIKIKDNVIYSYVDRTVRLRPRRRIIAKKQK